jgi:hypothetical protein
LHSIIINSPQAFGGYRRGKILQKDLKADHDKAAENYANELKQSILFGKAGENYANELKQSILFGENYVNELKQSILFGENYVNEVKQSILFGKQAESNPSTY